MHFKTLTFSAAILANTAIFKEFGQAKPLD